MEKYYCLICNSEMMLYDQLTCKDYHCREFKDDHHFAMRIRDHSMETLRVRFTEGNRRLCLKVHYSRGYSEIWDEANENSSDNRYVVKQIIVPDFMDIEKIKQKIKTILVFG